MIDLALFNEDTNPDFMDEFLKFHRVVGVQRLADRPDLCAFMLLEQRCPGGQGDMVTSAEHDQIWLHTDPHDFAAVALHEDALTLIRCGVFIHGELFSMYV